MCGEIGEYLQNQKFALGSHVDKWGGAKDCPFSETILLQRMEYVIKSLGDTLQ